MNQIVTLKNCLFQFVIVTFQLIAAIFFIILDLFDWFLSQIRKLIIFILRFLGPVSNAVYGQLNQRELYRVLAVAASSGASVYQILVILKQHAQDFVIDPVLASFVRAFINGLQANYFVVFFIIVVFVGDILRRMSQGEKPYIKDPQKKWGDRW